MFFNKLLKFNDNTKLALFTLHTYTSSKYKCWYTYFKLQKIVLKVKKI